MKRPEPADLPRFEAETLKVWDQQQTFARSLKQRHGQKLFRFFDGPPFANGLPHYGHALASTEKDAIVRYKTMRGYYVPRRAGWDTHGLPVEYEVEKQLGLAGKQQILAMGVDKFNEACRASVFKYKAEWEQFFRRFGRWVDTDNAYATMDDSFIESVWWVFAEIHKKGLVYQGFRSMPYCPRCATPLSNFELNQGYQDGVNDPSVYVLFPLADEPATALLAWTTTPWTLPANAALAVDPTADYVTVQLTQPVGEVSRLILAKTRLGELDLRQADYKVIKTCQGSELVGAQYQPLYGDLVEKAITFSQTDTPSGPKDQRETVWRVYADSSVSLEDGTGILHVAPRYGETDLALGLQAGLPLIESVDKFGRMTADMGAVAGMFFKEADPHIIAELTGRGRIFAAETFTHTYPFCWRCDSPLLYFATPSWFVRVSELRERLVANNAQVNWVPAHIKEGRFGNWLAEARDWGISRNRFWGAPLPVWVNEADPQDIIVVSSVAELAKLSGVSQFDMHRPGIDGVEIKRNGKTYRRVEEVFDCWFESGSMPYAEDHYPFEAAEEFTDKFPADFIAESMDQTRGWFYTLHVLATALFDQPAFKNVIVSGIVVAADGKKLSKRLKNYPDIGEVFDQYGADALRLFLSTSPAVAGEDVRFSAATVGEVYRNVLMTLYNVYSFLATYAAAAGWQPDTTLKLPSSSNVLDSWILARLAQTTADMTKHADNYEINRATRPLRDLIEDLSNWYVRRSRRRFWKNDDASDKAAAFATLHYVLVRICQLMAPWAPFLPDKLYRELTEGMDLPASVHLTDWPAAGTGDTELMARMNLVRQVVTVGLEQRARAGIKVRQPLAGITLALDPFEAGEEAIVKEELNVKAIVYQKPQPDLKIKVSDQVSASEHLGVSLDTHITPELEAEGLARDLIRLVQNARKEAGLTVEDQIKLRLEVASGGKLAQVIAQHTATIKQETLTAELVVTDPLASDLPPQRLAGEDVRLVVSKVA